VIDDVLRHLEALVAFDTRNPPRAIPAQGGVFGYLRDALPGFTHTLADHGDGAVSLLAVRGAPRVLFNFHLDTVPAANGWEAEPLRLRVQRDRAYGLGACDIKGAAAAMLVAASATDAPLALLFSSDEEANDARCVSGFLRTAHGFERVVVAEPTGARAVLAHRGIVSARAAFKGVAGHASESRALADNAIHRAVAWAERALRWAGAQRDARFGELSGVPFNLGRIEGGIKGNVIAPSCELRFGFRPLPSQSVDDLLGMLRGMASPRELEALEELFRGPPLPAGRGADAERQLELGRALAESLGLPLGPAVGFWTEASLFSAAGLAALVYGPGDIAQAHGPEEWVALDQLEQVAHQYQRMLSERRL
jgi:acetylornithine deacetylase